jgi:hypothetical protein
MTVQDAESGSPADQLAPDPADPRLLADALQGGSETRGFPATRSGTNLDLSRFGGCVSGRRGEPVVRADSVVGV